MQADESAAASRARRNALLVSLFYAIDMPLRGEGWKLTPAKTASAIINRDRDRVPCKLVHIIVERGVKGHVGGSILQVGRDLLLLIAWFFPA